MAYVVADTHRANLALPLIGVLMAVSSLVFIEPAPYDLLLVALLVVFLVRGMGIPREIRLPALLLGCFVLGNVLAALAAPAPLQSLRSLGIRTYMVVGWLFFVCVVAADAPRVLPVIWRGYLVAAAGAAAFGILEYYGFIKGLQWEAGTRLLAWEGGLRAKGPFKDANVLYQQQDYKRAAAAYEEAIGQDPNLTAAYFYLGNSYDNLYKPARAGEADNDALLQKAIENYKIASAGYLNVARALLADHRTSVRQTPVIRRVTLFWTLNDVYSRVDVGGPPGQVVREHGSSVLKWVRRYCRAYAWLKRLVFDRPKVCRRDDPRFVAALGDVVGLKALCDSAGVRMEIFLLPFEFQLRQTDSASLQPQRLLSQVLDSLTIAWYDPATTLRDAPGDPGGLYRFGDGIHFSPRGHLDIFSYLEGALHPSLTRFRSSRKRGFLRWEGQAGSWRRASASCLPRAARARRHGPCLCPNACPPPHHPP